MRDTVYVAERKLALLKREGRALASASHPPPPPYRAADSRVPRHVQLYGETFALHECPGDGSCFYHAVAHGMTRRHPGSAWDAARVRRATARGHIRSGDEERAVRARATSAWADDRDVQATANALGVEIRVWESANVMWISFCPASTTSGLPAILLHNTGNVHFDALSVL